MPNGVSMGIVVLLLRHVLPAGVERFPRSGNGADRSSLGGALVVPRAPEMPEVMEKSLEQTARRSFVDLLPPHVVQVATEHLESEMAQDGLLRPRFVQVGAERLASEKTSVVQGWGSERRKLAKLAPSPAVVTVPPPQDFDVL